MMKYFSFGGKGKPIYFFEYDRASDKLDMIIVSEALMSPNGITKNTDGTEIYVVDSGK
jgi:hypothetical protein